MLISPHLSSSVPHFPPPFLHLSFSSPAHTCHTHVPTCSSSYLSRSPLIISSPHSPLSSRKRFITSCRGNNHRRLSSLPAYRDSSLYRCIYHTQTHAHGHAHAHSHISTTFSSYPHNARTFFWPLSIISLTHTSNLRHSIFASCSACRV